MKRPTAAKGPHRNARCTRAPGSSVVRPLLDRGMPRLGRKDRPRPTKTRDDPTESEGTHETVTPLPGTPDESMTSHDKSPRMATAASSAQPRVPWPSPFGLPRSLACSLATEMRRREGGNDAPLRLGRADCLLKREPANNTQGSAVQKTWQARRAGTRSLLAVDGVPAGSSLSAVRGFSWQRELRCRCPADTHAGWCSMEGTELHKTPFSPSGGEGDFCASLSGFRLYESGHPRLEISVEVEAIHPRQPARSRPQAEQTWLRLECYRALARSMIGRFKSGSIRIGEPADEHDDQRMDPRFVKGAASRVVRVRASRR